MDCKYGRSDYHFYIHLLLPNRTERQYLNELLANDMDSSESRSDYYSFIQSLLSNRTE